MVKILFVANVCVGHAVVVGCCHVVQRCVHFSDIPGRSLLSDILVFLNSHSHDLLNSTINLLFWEFGLSLGFCNFNKLLQNMYFCVVW